MLNELGKSSSFGDIWPAFVDRGSAGFTSPSGRAFAGRSIAFGIAAAVAAWSILWHWVTTPPPTTTGRQPHRGFSVPKPDICSQSVYSARTYRSDLRNPRFQTHFLTLNPEATSPALSRGSWPCYFLGLVGRRLCCHVIIIVA